MIRIRACGEKVNKEKAPASWYSGRGRIISGPDSCNTVILLKTTGMSQTPITICTAVGYFFMIAYAIGRETQNRSP